MFVGAGSLDISENARLIINGYSCSYSDESQCVGKGEGINRSEDAEPSVTRVTDPAHVGGKARRYGMVGPVVEAGFAPVCGAEEPGMGFFQGGSHGAACA